MAIDFTRRMMLGAIPALGFAGAASAQVTGTRLAVPIEEDITTSLDAWVDTYGRPTAKVMLNDKGPYQFMVDTGSTTTVLAERVVAELAAPIAGQATVAGTTGTAVTPVAIVSAIQTGAVVRKDVRVAVLPDESLARIDGILGADVFIGKRLVFNIQAKQVRIEPSRRRQRTAPMGNMRVRNGLLAEVDGRVGNVGAKLMLDTGAQNCIANLPLSIALKRAHPRLERANNVRVYGVTGQVIIGEFIALPKVDMKAFSVKEAACVAADAPIFDLWGLQDEPAMIVGVNLLSRLSSFSIDYGSRVFDATLLSEMIARNSVAFG
jgi:predicted aspartyl protease